MTLDTSQVHGSTFLITGGTGSFGNAVLHKLLGLSLKEIRIFSRDEKKQDDMRKKYANEQLKFYIGDVRDEQSLLNATRGVDYIFHAAALKQVPSCEFYPLEAVKTNVLGTNNVLNAALANRVKKITCLSTDKAVHPINAMGTSKAMMEKIIVAQAHNADPAISTICCTRHGNVMASRGSVIPLFIQQIKNGIPITVTDNEMTRFMMSLDSAVQLVFYALLHGNAGDIFVQKSSAVMMTTLVEALKKIMDCPQHPVEIIGTRHGEKKHEVLLSREEIARADDLGDYYRIPPDFRGLNYAQYYEEGNEIPTQLDDYNSYNTHLLNVAEMVEMLLQLDVVQNLARGDHFPVAP